MLKKTMISVMGVVMMLLFLNAQGMGKEVPREVIQGHAQVNLVVKTQPVKKNQTSPIYNKDISFYKSLQPQPSQEEANSKPVTTCAIKNVEPIIKSTLVDLQENQKALEISQEGTLEVAVKQQFDQLLVQEQSELTLIPEGTRLNKVLVLEGDLLLDFSSELLHYGGNMWEEELVNLLLEKAFFVEGIKSVTITIDQECENFVEGTTINGYTKDKWHERKQVNDR